MNKKVVYKMTPKCDFLKKKCGVEKPPMKTSPNNSFNDFRTIFESILQE